MLTVLPLHFGRTGGGRSSLESSQPGTRAPSQSGFVINLSAASGSSPSRRIPQPRCSLSQQSKNCKSESLQKFGLKKNGIKHYRFHDLRHVNASVMLALNIPDKYAMRRMGHATNNMLKTVYQHTMSEKEQQVNASVDNYFESIIKPE